MQETPSCSVFEETRDQNGKFPETKFKKGVKLGGYIIYKNYFHYDNEVLKILRT